MQKKIKHKNVIDKKNVNTFHGCIQILCYSRKLVLAWLKLLKLFVVKC